MSTNPEELKRRRLLAQAELGVKPPVQAPVQFPEFQKYQSQPVPTPQINQEQLNALSMKPQPSAPIPRPKQYPAIEMGPQPAPAPAPKRYPAIEEQKQTAWQSSIRDRQPNAAPKQYPALQEVKDIPTKARELLAQELPKIKPDTTVTHDVKSGLQKTSAAFARAPIQAGKFITDMVGNVAEVEDRLIGTDRTRAVKNQFKTNSAFLDKHLQRFDTHYGKQSIPEKLATGVVEGTMLAPAFGAASKLLPNTTFGVVSAIEAAGKPDTDIKNIASSFGKGMTTDMIFRGAGNLKPVTRAVTVGAGVGTQTLVDGGSIEDAAMNAGTMAGLTLAHGGGGNIGVKELRKGINDGASKVERYVKGKLTPKELKTAKKNIKNQINDWKKQGIPYEYYKDSIPEWYYKDQTISELLRARKALKGETVQGEVVQEPVAEKPTEYKADIREYAMPEGPQAGGIARDKWNKSSEQLLNRMNKNPEKVEQGPIIRLNEDMTIKDISGENQLFKKGHEVRTKIVGGEALVNDGNDAGITKNKLKDMAARNTVLGQEPMGEEFEDIETITKGKITDPEKWKSLNKEKQQAITDWEKYQNKAKEIHGSSESLWPKETQVENKRLNDEATTRTRIADNAEKGDNTKFEGYRPAVKGDNYREVLFKAPVEVPTLHQFIVSKGISPREASSDRSFMGKLKKEYADKYGVAASGSPTFKSSHWDEPNVTSHARISDLKTPQGNMLNVEELQSDWATEGRKRGFEDKEKLAQANEELYKIQQEARDIIKLLPDGELRETLTPTPTNIMGDPLVMEAVKEQLPEQRQRIADLERDYEDYATVSRASTVPSHPYLKNWQENSLKRVLKMAAEEGYDGITWATGEQIADVYDLSKQVDKIDYQVNIENGTYDIQAYKDGNKLIEKTGINENELPEYIGKDLTNKVMNDGNAEDSFSGIDLKIGGEWAKNLYDKQIPNILKKLTKKWGGKIEQIVMPSSAERIKMKYNPETGNWNVSGLTPRGSNFAVNKKTKAEALEVVNKMGADKQLYLKITPQMREMILTGGQPMAGGKVRDKSLGAAGKDLYTDSIPLDNLPEELEVTNTEGKKVDVNFKPNEKVSIDLIETPEGETGYELHDGDTIDIPKSEAFRLTDEYIKAPELPKISKKAPKIKPTTKELRAYNRPLSKLAKASGGLNISKASGYKGELKSLREVDKNLVNLSKGESLEKHVEKAREIGLLPDDASIPDYLEAMGVEYLPNVETYTSEAAINKEEARQAELAGYKPEKKVPKKSYEKVLFNEAQPKYETVTEQYLDRSKHEFKDPILKKYYNDAETTIRIKRALARDKRLGHVLDARYAFMDMEIKTGVPVYQSYLDITKAHDDVNHDSSQRLEALFKDIEISPSVVINSPEIQEKLAYATVYGNGRESFSFDGKDYNLSKDELKLVENIKKEMKSHENIVKKLRHERWMKTGEMPPDLENDPNGLAMMQEGKDIFKTEDMEKYNKWLDSNDFGLRENYLPMLHKPKKVVIQKGPSNLSRGFTKTRQGEYFYDPDRHLIPELYKYIRKSLAIQYLEPKINDLYALMNENDLLGLELTQKRTSLEKIKNRISITNKQLLDYWKDVLLKQSKLSSTSKILMNTQGMFWAVNIPQKIVKWVSRNLLQPTVYTLPRLFDPLSPTFWKHISKLYSGGTSKDFFKKNRNLLNDPEFMNKFKRHISSLQALQRDYFFIDSGDFKPLNQISSLLGQISQLYSWSDNVNRIRALFTTYSIATDHLKRYRKNPTDKNFNKFLKGSGAYALEPLQYQRVLKLVDAGNDKEACFELGKIMADNANFMYSRGKKGLVEQDPTAQSFLTIFTFAKGSGQYITRGIKPILDWSKTYKNYIYGKGKPPNKYETKRAYKGVLGIAGLFIASMLANRIQEKVFGIDEGSYGLSTLRWIPGGLFIAQWTNAAESIWGAMQQRKGWDWKIASTMNSMGKNFLPFYDITMKVTAGLKGTKNFNFPMWARNWIKKMSGTSNEELQKRWVERTAVEKLQYVLLGGARGAYSEQVTDAYLEYIENRIDKGNKNKDTLKSMQTLERLIRLYPVSDVKKDKPRTILGITDIYPSAKDVRTVVKKKYGLPDKWYTDGTRPELDYLGNEIFSEEREDTEIEIFLKQYENELREKHPDWDESKINKNKLKIPSPPKYVLSGAAKKELTPEQIYDILKNSNPTVKKELSGFVGDIKEAGKIAEENLKGFGQRKMQSIINRVVEGYRKIENIDIYINAIEQ